MENEYLCMSFKKYIKKEINNMTQDRPLILVTNDDGVTAKGINELVGCLRDLGDIIVFAPDGPRSGMSSAITSHIPLKYKLLKRETGLTIYTCTGTPVDCVKLAINEVLDRRPDMLVSGINHGGNMAIAVNYSGTMGAAVEGCIFDVPSLGVSLLDHHPEADFTESCRFARMVARRVLKEGLPHGVYLNLNIPNIPQVKGLKVCRQADGKWVREYMKTQSPHDETAYWLTGDFENRKPIHPDNDTIALDSGYASLVPCKVDVTDYDYMETLRENYKL